MQGIVQKISETWYQFIQYGTDIATTVLAFLISIFATIATSGGGWLYGAVFLIALLESTPFLGVIVPGGILIILAGFFARMDIFSFWVALIFVSMGGIFGDILSYYLGKKLGIGWLEKRKRLGRIISIDKGKAYFTSHGNKSIFLARFVGPVRPVIPFVAGLFKMHRGSFLFFNISGGIVWALLYLSFGYFFGASWELAERWAGVLGFIVIATIIVWVFFAIIWRALQSQRAMIIRLVKEVFKSIGHAIKTNEDIRRWLERHPDFSQWCTARLSKNNLLGRYVTYGIIVGGYCLWHVIAIPISVLTDGVLLQLDVHMARLMVQLNDTTIGTIMFFITEIGSVPVVVSLLAVTAIICALYDRRRDALLGVAGLGATGVLVYLGKLLIHRPRPDIAPLFIESTFSLPSGHAAHATVLFGWVIYLIQTSNFTKKTKRIVTACLVVLIAVIGMSRIYLGVHWVSDVLAGYMLGCVVLSLLIVVSEFFRRQAGVKKNKPIPEKYITRRLAWVSALIFVELIIVVFVYATQTPVIKPILPPSSVKVLSEQELSSYIEHDMPKHTQTLSGRPQEPISFVIVGTREQVVSAFKRADWFIADPVNSSTLSRVAWAVIKNDSYPTAPVTPVFYNGYPQDFAVQKETDKGSARQRHHARFWRADIRLTDGREVWVGTASYDVGIKRFYTHRIDPAIDTERDFMYRDLVQSNVFEREVMLQMTERILGRNFTGDLFFTDGKAYFLMLPIESPSF